MPLSSPNAAYISCGTWGLVGLELESPLVTDAAPDRLPTPARERPAGGGGYGLYVIADLTATHGVHREPNRKHVWVCLIKPT